MPRILDLSGPVNLITNQDLSNPYWTLSGFTFNGPNGVLEVAASSAHTVGMATGLTRTIGTGVYTCTADLAKTGADQRFFLVGVYSIGLGSGGARYFDVLNGINSATNNYGGFLVTASSITNLGGGVFRCSVTVDCTGSAFAGVLMLNQDSTPLGTFTYLGVVSDGYAVSNLTLVRVS